MSGNKNQFLSGITGYVSTIGSHQDPVGKEGLTRIVANAYKYGTRSSDSLIDIYRRFESTGANMYIFVDQENLVISMSAPKQNLKVAQSIFSEIVFQTDTSATDLDKIKAKQIAKIHSLKSNDISYAATTFSSLVGGQRFSLGTVESIENIQLKDVHSLQRKLNKDFVRFHLSKDLKLKSDRKIPVNKVRRKKYDLYGNKRAVFLERDIEQKVVIYGYQTPGGKDFEAEVHGVASAIMSSGLAGLVSHRIREENSAAYYADFGSSMYYSKGSVYMYAGVSEKNVEMTIDIMEDLFWEVAAGKFSDRRFHNAKNYYLGKIDRSHDSAMSIVENALTRKLYGYYQKSYESKVKKASRVTRKEVEDHFKMLSAGKKPYLVINGTLPKKVRSNLEMGIK